MNPTLHKRLKILAAVLGVPAGSALLERVP
jgi:hypothetical protein